MRKKYDKSKINRYREGRIREEERSYQPASMDEGSHGQIGNGKAEKEAIVRVRLYEAETEPRDEWDALTARKGIWALLYNFPALGLLCTKHSFSLTLVPPSVKSFSAVKKKSLLSTWLQPYLYFVEYIYWLFYIYQILIFVHNIMLLILLF